MIANTLGKLTLAAVAAAALSLAAGTAQAGDFLHGGGGGVVVDDGFGYGGGYGGVGLGGGIGGVNTPYLPYSDQRPWMHGYFQEMPVHHGFHYFRPYNYKHIISQSAAAAALGMPPQMPYSQQVFSRYNHLTDLQQGRVYAPRVAPMPGGHR